MKKLGIIAVSAIALCSLYFVKAKSGAKLRIETRDRVGTEVSSRLELEDKALLQLGSGENSKSPAFQQEVRSLLKADLHEKFLAADGDDLRSFLTVSSVELQLDLGGKPSEGLRDRVLAGLGKGAWILRDKNGAVRDVRVSPETDDAAREFLILIAQSIQYSLPEGEHEHGVWTAEERDRNGTYRAEYKVSGHSAVVWSIEKTRVDYEKLDLQLTGSIGNQGASAKSSGSKVLSFDAEKQEIVGMTGEENLDIFDRNSRKIGYHKQRIDWKRTATRAKSVGETETAAPAADFEAAPSMDEARKDFQLRQDRMMYEQRLGSTTLRDLQAFYTIDGQSDEAQTENFLKLRAFVYLHPEEFGPLGEDLRIRDIKDPFLQKMVSALVSISSPEAQKLLVDLTLARRGEEAAMETMVPQLGFVQNPDVIVADTLRELKNDAAIRGMVDLAYGTMGSQLAKVDSDLARERLKSIEAEVLADIETAKDDRVLRHHLDVLGNLASVEAVGVAEKTLLHQDSKVRETAVYTLRDVEGVDAENLIVKTLDADQDPQVRYAAAQALSQAKPSQDLLSHADRLLEKETDSKVRLAFLATIEKARYVNADQVKEILTRVKDRDADADVRKTADLILTQFEDL